MTLMTTVQKFYEWCTLTASVYVARARQEQVVPWIIFPWLKLPSAENNSCERQVLCQFKSLFNKKRQLNKEGCKGYDVCVRQFDTVN